MGQPWGLSGPQFLVVYGVGFGVILLITAIAWQFVRGLPSRRPARPLDHYEVAFLAGGKQRVAEVVIAELIDRGALRVDGRGRLYLADTYALSGPFVASLGTIPPNGVTSHMVRMRLSGAPGMKEIAERLRGDGLLISRGRLIATRWLVGLMMAALLVTGALRMIEGHSNHRPINDLIAEFIASILLGLWLLNFTFKNSNSTRYGHWYLRKLRKTPLAADATMAGAGLPGAQYPFRAGPVVATAAVLGVALWGWNSISDQTVRAALIAGLPSSTTSGCGTSGCGGGGCGGGGCGG